MTSKVFLCLLFCIPLGNTTWYVDGSNTACPGSGTKADPFCAIQTALGTAQDGDSVLVAPGTYRENLDFLGKAILLKSQSGPAKTIIDGGQQGPVVTFRTGEGPSSILDGFTITNGIGVCHFGCDQLSGGGVACIGSAPTIRNNTITSNHVNSNGGGVSLIFSYGAILADNYIVGNSAVGGGAVAIGYSDTVVSGNSIRGNVAVVGGGILIWEGAAPDVFSNCISGNSADVSGGGITVRGGPALIEANRIVENLAGQFGGGVENEIAGTMRLVNNRIEANRATNGGGVRCVGPRRFSSLPPAVLANNTIVGNVASQRGGGLLLDYTDYGQICENNLIARNLSYGDGGGVFIRPPWELTGNVITSNTAHGAGGGVLVSAGVLTNNTITTNLATRGGGMYFEGHTQVANTIAWGNTPDSIATGPFAVASVVYSDVQGGYPGPGNFDADPAFRNELAGDFRLTCSSPCVDSGSTSSGGALPLFDQEGLDLRVIGPIDVGADEFGLFWEMVGNPRAGSGSISFRATGAPSLSGAATAFVFLSLACGEEGLPIPGSSGRTLELTADALFNHWLVLPRPLRKVLVAGCPGADTVPFTVPGWVPVGFRVFYAGFATDNFGAIPAVSRTGSFTTL